MNRKKYAKPSLESQQSLEQISLGCNAVPEVPGELPEPKGGNFNQIMECDTLLLTNGEECGLDIVVVLS